MYKLLSKKLTSDIYFYDQWDNEKMLMVGFFLFDNVMISPEYVIKMVQKIGDEYRSNTHYAIYTEKGVEIGHQWDDDTPLLMPYDKFIQLLEKWRTFLDSRDSPEKLLITMDDEYNFTFEYELDGKKKVI